MNAIEIGRLLRAGTAGCVVGCKVTQMETPEFGGMVRIPLEDGYDIYGLIYDIHIDDDGLVRQLATASAINEQVIQDNRVNRNVPVEVSVLFTGYELRGEIMHLLPPRPPLTLDRIFACTPAELCRFTAHGRFGYFRHVLRAGDLPVGELLAAHLRLAAVAHAQSGRPDWRHDATRELIVLLRDDYGALMSVLSALGDTGLFQGAPQSTTARSQ
ncbi:MAG: hypothetical protein HPY76_03655 [Anaerolineae bacterium]|nr:hypothetical protein [Anaerolineae bacterium]